ncbi:MAG TPA: prenyltransferase/squalene oxidase repeat-containing protein [Bacteroidales bacterium]|nr:prenyltransferase/squalene oxidase repeat-containing protein [Bacteroidales bacterium]
MEKISQRYSELRAQLISKRNPEGFWTGRLSTSALSTSVAIVALKLSGNPDDRNRVETGFSWLCRNINSDGGYGDTPESLSNLSTTLLCYSAIHFCQNADSGKHVLSAMDKWLAGKGISIDSPDLVRSILDIYGNDYTFSVPILSMLTLCGVLPASSLDMIPRLPFELTLLPSSFYRFLNLRVVSYALPALIGVGIYHHRKKRKGFAGIRYLRERLVKPAIKKLDGLLPESGGFLEAIPLTGFVAMCLTECGETDNNTVEKGLHFLRNQQRSDGGWPIDTDLSTWVTTLSVKALGNDIWNALSKKEIEDLRNHLLRLQYTSVHPFNGASPGGWGWTSYSGSVPDADDTPGAILALLMLFSGEKAEVTAIENGCRWLTGLQNSDGGFPTFCRGWGKLPFDRSCADLTGHALLALLKSVEILHDEMDKKLLAEIDRSISKAMLYLEKHQSGDGSWLPLWFGNQLTDDKTNPVYGTAKVCIYLKDTFGLEGPGKKYLNRIEKMVRKAEGFLLDQQNSDGSWGGKKGIEASFEETSLAVSALAGKSTDACNRGIQWLMNRDRITASPIGLYFAMLWYDEELYPLIYSVEAFRRFLKNK